MTLPRSELGDGPAVVLLHAGIADRRMWDEQLAPLAAAGHRVVAVDLPGFGEATPGPGPVAHWEDVLETMDALGIERAALVGSSFGAQVALRVAVLAPGRVTALLLFSASAVPEPDPSPELLAVWDAEEEALGAGVEQAVEAVVSAWVGPNAPEEVRDRIVTMQRRNYELKTSAQEVEFAPDPLEEDPALLTRIECPVLLAAGEHDMVDFRNAVGELATVLPRPTTTLIPACGHLAPLEAPEEFRRFVFDNLR